MSVKMSLKNVTRWLVFLSTLVMFSMITSVAQAATSVSPVGNWTKVNPDTKKPEAVIQISEDEDHTIFGKVITIYDPTKNKTVCEDCPEDFKNKPIVGMEVLWGLKQASDYTWTGGSLLSPRLGKVFSCNLTLSQDGQTLTVRVYTRSALLGKTQTWYRAA